MIDEATTGYHRAWVQRDMEYAHIRATPRSGRGYEAHVHISAWQRLPRMLGSVRPSIREERRQVSVTYDNHVINLVPVPMAGEVVWYKAVCTCGEYESRVVNYQKAGNLGLLHVVALKKKELGVGR